MEESNLVYSQPQKSDYIDWDQQGEGFKYCWLS